MATIFTDEAFQGAEFAIEPPAIGHAGDTLVITWGDSEIRLTLHGDSLKNLAFALAEAGIDA